MISICSLAVWLLLAWLTHQWLNRRQEYFKYFKRRGIAGPEPNVLFGNALEIYTKGHPQAVKDWSHKFGNLFGYFNGVTPVIVVLDAEIIREIQTSQCDLFTKRGVISLTSIPLARSVFRPTDSRWCISRNIILNALSDNNLSMLFDDLNSILDECGNCLNKAAETQTSIDLCKLIKAYCADLYCKACLGHNYGILKDLQHPMVDILEDISTEPYGLLLVLLDSLPSLSNCILIAKSVIDKFTDASEEEKEALRQKFTSDINEAIRLRRNQDTKKSTDILQFLIDSHNDTNGSISESNTNKNKDAGCNSTSHWQNNILENIPNRLSDDELFANIWMFLTMAESTSAALVSLCFCLIKYPDIQEELRTKLFELFPTVEDEESIDLTELLKAPYLDAVIKESLRLYPPSFQIIHKPVKNATLSNGLEIMPTDLLCIPVDGIHRSKEFFLEPDVFLPERFLETQIDPRTFQAFGNEPRGCVTVKFTEAILKLTICRLLLTYRLSFSDIDGSGEELEMIALTTIQRSAKPLMARIEKLPEEDSYKPPVEPTVNFE